MHIFEVGRRNPNVRARLQQPVDYDALMQRGPGQETEPVRRRQWVRSIVQRVKTDSVWKLNADSLAARWLVV